MVKLNLNEEQRSLVNEEQRSLVNEKSKSIILLASAGTGKTNTLSKRIEKLIEEDKVNPSEILCITFTNKACKEMSERIEKSIKVKAKELTIKTFHSFCFDIIKTQAKKNTDTFTDFVIFDEEDCKELIGKCNYFNKDISKLQRFIDLVKAERAKVNINNDKLKDYKSIVEYLFKLKEDKLDKIFYKEDDDELKEFLRKEGYNLVITYNALLQNNHALDFNDLIINASELLNNEEVVNFLINKYKYINIDEVQDTSTVEYFIIEKLFKGNYVLICGDIFQTIYGWRGSEPEKIFSHFNKKYNPKKIIFSKNYRATKNLTEASVSYIERAFPQIAVNVYKKKIQAESESIGEKIKLKINYGLREEARFIFDEIKKLQNQYEDLSSMCVLTRNNMYNEQLSKYFKEFDYEGVNFEFVLVDQFKFFRRQEIKDIIAFLKFLINKNDSLSLKRIIDRLPTGVGDKTLKLIESKEYKDLGIRLSDYIDTNTIDYGEKFGLLINELEKDNIVVFDVESTGINVTKDEIIQIAAIKINKHGEIIEIFEKFIKNEKSVGASKYIHGFTDEFLNKNGTSKNEVLKEFLNFAKNTIIVGHNVQFDINILNSELEKRKLGKIKLKGVYDTLDIYRRFYPNMNNYKLETLSKEFQLSHKPSHNAMDDILATKELLIKAMSEKIKPTSMERMTFMSKHIKAFNNIALKLNNLFKESYGLRPYEIIGKIVNDFNIKSIYEGNEGKIKIERLKDFYVLARELDDKINSNKDALLEFVKITGLSNGELEALIINRTKIPRIPIITVHQAKGLEFETVFLAGAQKNTFPSYMALKNKSLGEEKRTFYVAITRAKKNLYITCNTKGSYGRVNEKSEFIKYIDCNYVEEI